MNKQPTMVFMPECSELVPMSVYIYTNEEHEAAQQALKEHAANKEDKWKELEDWVEDNFSKTNDYGTSLTFQGEEIISKIQSLKPLPTPPKTNKL